VKHRVANKNLLSWVKHRENGVSEAKCKNGEMREKKKKKNARLFIYVCSSKQTQTNNNRKALYERARLSVFVCKET